ncbi:hypothetical protein K9L05_00005 [Candidatus Babeliales bacterium]|nr:hypothetical protein [Candidatus Babeliales bacterium]
MRNNLTKLTKAFLFLSFFCFLDQISARDNTRIIRYKNLFTKQRGDVKIDATKTISDLVKVIKDKEKLPKNSRIDIYADKKFFKVSKSLNPNKKIKDCIIKKKVKKGKKRKPDFYYVIRPNSVIPRSGPAYLH